MTIEDFGYGIEVLVKEKTRQQAFIMNLKRHIEKHGMPVEQIDIEKVEKETFVRIREIDSAIDYLLQPVEKGN